MRMIESPHVPEDTVFFMQEYARLAVSHPNAANRIRGLTEEYERALFRDGIAEIKNLRTG
jgi:hypothetical protein